jgi:hypothetical protein
MKREKKQNVYLGSAYTAGEELGALQSVKMENPSSEKRKKTPDTKEKSRKKKRRE